MIIFFILIFLGCCRWGGFELLHCPMIKYSFVSSLVCLLALDVLKKKVTIIEYSGTTVGHVILCNSLSLALCQSARQETC